MFPVCARCLRKSAQLPSLADPLVLEHWVAPSFLTLLLGVSMFVRERQHCFAIFCQVVPQRQPRETC